MNHTMTIAALAVALSAVGCAETPRRVVIAHGQDAFPSVSLKDWVSYAEHHAQVTIVSEEEVPPPQSVFDNGEGYIARRVRAKVDQVIWSNSGSRPLPSEVDILVSGWLYKDGKKITFALHDSPRVEVGGKYRMPLVKYQRGWGPLTPGSVASVESDAIAAADVNRFGSSSLSRELAKKSSDEVRAGLAAETPDVLAVRFWNLDPERRREAVINELRQKR